MTRFVDEFAVLKEVGLPARTRRSLSDWFVGDKFPATPDDPEEALTYDALLTLRGWGVEEFREFPGEVQAAARWALFAEKVAPMLLAQRAIRSVPLDGLPPKAKIGLAVANLSAARQIAILEKVLYGD